MTQIFQNETDFFIVSKSVSSMFHLFSHLQ